MPDLWLPSQPQSVTAPWPVINYTVWWQRHMGVNNLPRVVTSSSSSSNDKPGLVSFLLAETVQLHSSFAEICHGLARSGSPTKILPEPDLARFAQNDWKPDLPEPWLKLVPFQHSTIMWWLWACCLHKCSWPSSAVSNVPHKRWRCSIAVKIIESLVSQWLCIILLIGLMIYGKRSVAEHSLRPHSTCYFSLFLYFVYDFIINK